MQTTEVAYNAIDFQDAITILPIMDELANRYSKTHRSLLKLKAKKDAGESVYSWDSEVKELRALWNQLKVLDKLGFVCSDPEVVQESEFLYRDL